MATPYSLRSDKDTHSQSLSVTRLKC